MIRLEPFALDPRELIGSVAATWAMAFGATLLLRGVFGRFFRSRRIQERPFDRRVLLHELLFSALNACVAGSAIGFASSLAAQRGALTVAREPASWAAVAAEFALYFFAFDLYFYAMHRLMHVGPIYRWIHAVHHRNPSPNPLTGFSFHPLEAILTGSFLVLFLVVVEVHSPTLALLAVGLGPVSSIFVHSGFEVFPRWWYRSPFTRWLLTPMFHDQHHQLYDCNYGGFTTIWDRVFGTVNPSFDEDYARHHARRRARRQPPVAAPAGAT